MKIALRFGNAFAAITVIVLLAILFMGYWIAIPIYGLISDTMLDNSRFENQQTESSCNAAGGYWVSDSCEVVSDRASEVIAQQRKAWLAAPIIFTISMIIWFWTKSFHRDPQQYGGQ